MPVESDWPCTVKSGARHEIWLSGRSYRIMRAVFPCKIVRAIRPDHCIELYKSDCPANTGPMESHDRHGCEDGIGIFVTIGCPRASDLDDLSDHTSHRSADRVERRRHQQRTAFDHQDTESLHGRTRLGSKKCARRHSEFRDFDVPKTAKAVLMGGYPRVQSQ